MLKKSAAAGPIAFPSRVGRRRFERVEDIDTNEEIIL